MDSQVQAILSKKIGGVYCFSYNGERYWLKAFGEDKNNVVRRLSNIFCKLFKFDILKNNSSSMNMNQRLNHEKEIIKLLNNSSDLAPKIIKEDEGYFITKDAGDSLKSVKNDKLNEAILNEVFQGLMNIHRMNLSHGRPAMRDILLGECNELVFIDFEEAAIEPSVQLKARDFMLLIIDLATLELNNDLFDKVISFWLKKENQDVIDAFFKLYTMLNKVKFLARVILLVKPRNRLSNSIIKALDSLDRISK